MAKVEHVKAIAGAQCASRARGRTERELRRSRFTRSMHSSQRPFCMLRLPAKNLQDHTVRIAHEIL
jgi:hypothetical protein